MGKMFTAAEVREHVDKAIKAGTWNVVIQSLVADLYDELHATRKAVGNAMRSLQMQNEFLFLRVDGKTAEEASAIVKKKYGGAPAPAPAPQTEAPAEAPVEQEAPQPAPSRSGEVRLGADGEPLSPEAAAMEDAMDQAINAGIKAGVANPIE